MNTRRLSILQNCCILATHSAMFQISTQQIQLFQRKLIERDRDHKERDRQAEKRERGRES